MSFEFAKQMQSVGPALLKPQTKVLMFGKDEGYSLQCQLISPSTWYVFSNLCVLRLSLRIHGILQNIRGLLWLGS